VVGDVDSEDENVSQLDDLHGEDGIAFPRWPWRALNRQVSSACAFIFIPKRLVHDYDHSVQWWKWQLESALCCCCSDESDNDE
jgi:hypothetical protein